ncbi:MAG: hypothetical protein IJ616_02335 [Bacteroidales bacterium]|nr:hypothetical protein [Bacteroidales bacterium]
MRTYLLLLPVLAGLILPGCSSGRKIGALRSGQVSASLSLPREQSALPEVDTAELQRDTMTVTDLNGREVTIMNAVKDENGEMVATDVLKAATVTARFRNVAERHGKVELCFQVIVPEAMQDSRWQLRFYPMMFLLGDSTALANVVITGKDYRQEQLRGYQHYERFLKSIIDDPDHFIRHHQLEVFIRRNIPQLYRFRRDSSFVSEEEFRSSYGVSGEQAIRHYTRMMSLRWNNRKISRKDLVFKKRVKVPIQTEGLRLDTVIQQPNGDFIYDYVQEVAVRPKLKKVDITLEGEIYEQADPVFRIPRSKPLTFYISSLSTLADGTERYLKRILERRVEANTACYIDFGAAQSDIDPELGNNASEIGRIKQNLRSLVENEVFEMDSITVTASCSPEGDWAYNERLSRRRSEAVSTYFGRFVRDCVDSLRREQGAVFDLDGSLETTRQDIRFIARSDPENWRMLDELVRIDSLLLPEQKSRYESLRDREPDARERLLQEESFYPHLREKLYPRLRTVRFGFFLHRKGMLKDTVHTTVLDTAYMQGVQAIRDRDYERAVTLLRPYKDYNTAVAYCSMDYNASALSILETLPRDDKVNYLLAIVYSRRGDERSAVECYIRSCQQNPSMIHRGNLDPEISQLIRQYGLNQEPSEP